MKKLIMVMLLALIIAAVSHAESPTDAGVYSLSGSISYSHKEVDHADDVRRIWLSPKLVYFVYPNLAIGSSLLYTNSKTGSSESESYGIGPVIRYYMGKESSYPFVSLEYTYNENKTKGGSYFSPYDYHSSDIALGFGMDYFISKNVAFEPMISYILRYSGKSISYAHPDEQELLIGIGMNAFIF